MKYLFILSMIVLFLGCDNRKFSQKQNEASWIHYYKDSRTGLCFAGDGMIDDLNHLAHDHSHLTQVPCTDIVEKLVEPWPNYEF